MAIDNWYDGDTFYEDGERRRLYGGDAPEKRSNQPGWGHALGAAERATELGFTPRQVTDRETFGRQLVAMEAPDGAPTLEAEMLGAQLATGLPSRLGGATNLNEYLSGARAMTGDTGGALANDPKFMQLTEDARIERLDRLMGGLRDGSLTAHLNAPDRRSDPTNSDGYEYVDAAFARGVDNMQGTFYGFADALGQVAGIDVLSEWGQEGVAANVIEAMRNPAKVESYEDIDGLADAGVYALEAVGEFAPQLLTDVAAGIATGGGTVAAKQLLAGGAKALLRKTGGSMATAAPRRLAVHGWEAFAPAAKAGAFASAYMQNTGETQNQFAAEDIEAPGEALLIGAGKAALDYAGLDVTLRQAFKGFNKADAGDALKIGDWLKSSAGATLTAFSAESVTEGAQTLMDELAIQGHKPEHEINWAGVVDAMLKGGIGGGTATAAGQVVTRLVGGQTPAVPGANDGLQDTAAEPLRDIIAQVLNTPAGEGNWYTRENAEQAKQAAAEAGKSVRELPDGSVVVGDQGLLDSVSDEPTQADIARVNGYAQTKDEALADPQGAVVVETVDQNGAVLRNQIVGASIAEEVRAAQEQKFPNATTSITTPVATVGRRALALAQERGEQVDVFELDRAGQVRKRTRLSAPEAEALIATLGDNYSVRLASEVDSAEANPQPPRHSESDTAAVVGKRVVVRNKSGAEIARRDVPAGQTPEEALAKAQAALANDPRMQGLAVSVEDATERELNESERRKQQERYTAEPVTAAQRTQAKPIDSPEQLIAEAERLGIDPSVHRTDSQGEFGKALLRRIRTGLAATMGKGEKRGAPIESLAPLARLVDMAPEELTVDAQRATDSKGRSSIFASRAKLLERFWAAVNEKYGSPEAFGAALDQMDAAELAPIREAFGIEVEAGVDYAALRREVMGRRGVEPRPAESPLGDEPAGEVSVAEFVEVPAGTPGAVQNTSTQKWYARKNPAPAKGATREQPLVGAGDRVLREILGNPMLRQLLAPERGKRPNGEIIDERLEALSPAQRLHLEAWLERMGIDIGGPKRELFMELVADAVVERAPDPEVGAVLVDDENRSEDGEVTYVPTVNSIDAYRDDKGVRFLRILNSTPLADRNKSGWNDGLSLYVEALAAIVADNTVGDGVTEQERTALQQGRLVAQVLAELGVTLGHSKSALRHVATAFGLTPEVLKRLTDGAQEDGAVALGELVRGTADQRAAKALSEELAARLVTEDDMTSEERTRQLRKEARSEPVAVAEQLLLTLRELGLGQDGFEEFWANEFDARRLAALLEGKTPVREERVYPDADARRGAKITRSVSYTPREGETAATPVSTREAGFSSAQRAAGEEASVDDNPRLLTDQQGSDDTFYGAIGAASLKHWDFSLMPTAEQLEDQLRKHGFRSGRAQAHTELLKGANLLSVPAADGSLAGRIVDAISLTEYAQAGEQVPATPAEAGRNFLENLSRLLAGRQTETRRTEFTATGPREASPSWLEAAVVRRLPSSLVIFLDPASGQPVTLGQALKAMGAGKDTREEALLLQREVDELSDQIATLTEQANESIAALEEKLALATDAPRDQDLKAVLNRWVQLLRGEKIDVNGRKAYPRKPSKASFRGFKDRDGDTAAGEPARVREAVEVSEAWMVGAFERIGKQKFGGDKTLDELYTERLAMLGRLKKLRAKAKRAQAAWENTGAAVLQEDKVRSDLAAPDTVNEDEGGVISNTEVQALLDGKEGMPNDGNAELEADEEKLNGEREFDPITDRPDPLGRVSLAHREEALAALAREGRLEAMTTASKLAPAPTEAPVRRARARKDGAAKTVRHWWDARTATGIGARFQGLLSTLREAGVPIPELQIFVADAGVPLETQLAQSELTLFEQQLVLDQIAAGESGYFMNADDVPVVFLASRPSLDHQLLDFAHELGHVVKDQVWDGLLAEHRAELMAGFKAQYGFEPQNEVQMHEWFADQFARAVASDAGTLGAQHDEKSLIAKAIAKLLTYLRNIWEKVNGQSPDVNPHFRAFARSLFQGQYRDSRAAAETNIQQVFNASGTTREQRRMTRLQAPGGPVWVSADGLTTIRGRKRLDAGDQELENAVGLLNMGHAAWMVEGNSFWDVDLFVKTEYGVVENVGHGVFQLRDSDGSVQAIHDIKVYTKRKGHGEMLVASILASGESIHIVEAVPEAQAFWNAMGANDGYDQYKNVRLTWGDYVTAKQNRGAGERSNSGRTGDVGSAVREESLAADDGRGQGSAGPDDGRSEAETESLDAESLAFIEEFLGKKPKVYNASGIEALNKQAAARNQLLKTQANAFWKKGIGAVKGLAPLYSMVHTRIARINPGLARALFQPANERQSSVGQSWEQRSRALKGRMLAQLDKLLSDLRSAAKGTGLKADTAIQAAFEDAYTGTPKTLFGNRVKRLLEDMVVEAKRAGLRSVDLADLLVASNLGLKAVGPVVFDRQALTSRPADFQKLLTDAGIEAAEAREIFNRIVDGPGTLEGAIAPGMPVGMHKTNRELVEKLGYDQLKADGWVLGKHAEALFHWVDGVSKRAAWESIFGETRKGEFDPNAKFIDQLQIIRTEQGENAAQEVLALVNGALGRHPAAQFMPGWFRNAQEFITGWVGMTVLAFSGVASIPELAMPMVRGGGRVSMREMFTDLGEARKFARDMGIVLSDASEQVMWQATGEQYQSPRIRKAQRYFFRYNGNELIVRTSRILATNVAMRYVLKAAAEGDHAALARLNTDAKTVLAWDAAGRPAWSPEQSADLQVISAAVGDAINQFVNEATLNPSRFQATHWGNNPYLKMIWHLKHFLYAMGDTVMLGMYREMKRRWSHMGAADFNKLVAVAMPALIFGLCVLPLAAASMELRDWIRYYNGQQRNEYEGAFDYLQQTFSRSGGFGPIEFLINLRENQEQGRSIWGTISPVLGKGDMLFGRQPLEEKVRQMTPVFAQNKGLWEMVTN